MMLGSGLQGKGESSRRHSTNLILYLTAASVDLEKLKEVSRLVELLENDFSAKKLSSAGKPPLSNSPCIYAYTVNMNAKPESFPQNKCKHF
jgi:hypothetical protein